jgi:hypothetical protein
MATTRESDDQSRRSLGRPFEIRLDDLPLARETGSGGVRPFEVTFEAVRRSEQVSGGLPFEVRLDDLPRIRETTSDVRPFERTLDDLMRARDVPSGAASSALTTPATTNEMPFVRAPSTLPRTNPGEPR